MLLNGIKVCYMNYSLKVSFSSHSTLGSTQHNICRLVLCIEVGLDTGSSIRLREYKTSLMWRIVFACVIEVVERELEFHTIRTFQSCLVERHVAVT